MLVRLNRLAANYRFLLVLGNGLVCYCRDGFSGNFSAN